MADMTQLSEAEIAMVNEHRRQIAEQAEQQAGVPQSPGVDEHGVLIDANSPDRWQMTKDVFEQVNNRGGREIDAMGAVFAATAHRGFDLADANYIVPETPRRDGGTL